MKIISKANLMLAFVCIVAYLSLHNTSGSYQSNGGRTNAPFDNGNCSSTSGCHTPQGSFNPVVSVQLISGSTPVTTYTSNTSYTLRITISSSGTGSSTRYGFQCVCVQSSSNNDINNWGTMPTNTKKWAINSRTYTTHSNPLTSGVINIPWTSPATTTGNITFYAAGLVADGNFQQTNDNYASTTLTITPASAGCTLPTINTAATHVSCYGYKTGAITTTVTGGSSPFNFDWSGPNFSANTKDISGIGAGTYTLILTATGGCKDTVQVTVNEPPVLNVNISSNSPVCIGKPISLMATAGGGNGSPFTYGWSGPGSASSTVAGLIISNATNNHNGDYVVTVQDKNGCTLKDTTTVQVDSMPVANKIEIVKIGNNSYNFNIDNPRYNTSQLWLFGDGKSDTVTSTNHTYTSKGSYTVKLILKNHCGNDTLTELVNAWPENIAGAGKAADMILYPNPSTGFLRIAGSGSSINSIRILNTNGAVCYARGKVGTEEVLIDTKNIPAGMYIVHVQYSGGQRMLPLQIIH